MSSLNKNVPLLKKGDELSVTVNESGMVAMMISRNNTPVLFQDGDIKYTLLTLPPNIIDDPAMKLIDTLVKNVIMALSDFTLQKEDSYNGSSGIFIHSFTVTEK